MKKHMTQEVAIKSAWMILEGLGFSREINGDLEKTVTAVYESAPAADVTEVVRCRDCFYNAGESRDLYGNPVILCVTAVKHEPDWYCASGKRKDGGHEE